MQGQVSQGDGDGDGMQGGRMCEGEGEGVRRQEGVQGHATVMVTGCEVGRMCKGMQGRRQERGHVRACNSKGERAYNGNSNGNGVQGEEGV